MPRHKTGVAIARKAVKSGKSSKIWFARIEFRDDSGRLRRIERKPDFNTKSSARDKARAMLSELDNDRNAFDAVTMTFSQLADHYKQTFLIDAEYRGDRKIAGLRSKYTVERQLVVLRAYFGKKRLRSITHSDLVSYKAQRLRTPVVVGRNTRGTESTGKPEERERSIASVHRELALLRRMLNVAVSNAWIVRNPFETGEPLIRPGDEKPRERIISKEEEERLLAVCEGKKSHLRAIIICALDTGMRRGEMFKLKWSDVNLENRRIAIQAFNTKTMREREVGITDRLAIELLALRQCANGALVFGIKTSVNSSFEDAKKKAGLLDLRFHDLRHTHATRLVGASMPLSEVGRMLGHTQANTTYRYVNANSDTARRAVELLNQFNAPQQPAKHSQAKGR